MQAVRDQRRDQVRDRPVSEFLEERRLYGPGGVRWPALMAGIICIGVVFAPLGALACAVVAFLASHPIQRRWRGAFIIVAALFVVATLAGFYLLDGEGGEGAPPGADDVTGSLVLRDA